MKQINADFYVIEPELYAERRPGGWLITDEQAKVVAGPFASLELLEASLTDARVPEEAKTFEGEAIPAPKPEDLVTLREAATFLPVTRQALEARKRRGTLKVSPVVVGRSTELYSLKQLKEAFPNV